MYPLVLSHPRIQSYGAMFLLAWVLGWWLARCRASRIGIAAWHIDLLMPLLLLSAGVASRWGARLFQVLFDGGGNDRVLFAGLLAPLGVVIAYAVIARLPIGRLADAFALSLPLGIAVLRVGCFLAGCCWGDICGATQGLDGLEEPRFRQQVQTIPRLSTADCPLCVTFPAGSPAYQQHRTAGLLALDARRSLPVHPVQLYEATACLALFFLLLAIDRGLRLWGESLLAFSLGYALIRFVVEWFRADNAIIACGWTLPQICSVACAGGCVLLWIARRNWGQQASRRARLQ